MVELTIPLLLDIIRTLGILVGVYYYITTIRTNQRNQELQIETRQAQIFTQMANKWNDIEFKKVTREILEWEWVDLNDWIEKYGGADDQGKFNSVGAYFEVIGILLMKRLLDLELVDNLFSFYVTRFWEKYESLFIEIRERYNSPQSGEWFEYLYKRIKEIMLEQHPELEGKPLGYPRKE